MIATTTLFILMNLARITPLSPDPILNQRAEIRAEYLCQNNQWSHTNWLMSFKGYENSYRGENLAKGFTNTNDMFQGLMASPTHRANILNSHYTKVGIGTECGITVELFAS